MRLGNLGAVVVAGAMLVAGAANAEVMIFTASGTADGTDDLGLFGAAGAVYSGAAFTATFEYETTGNTRVTTATADSLNGAGAPATPAVTSATFSLEGVDYTFAVGGVTGYSVSVDAAAGSVGYFALPPTPFDDYVDAGGNAATYGGLIQLGFSGFIANAPNRLTTAYDAQGFSQFMGEFVSDRYAGRTLLSLTTTSLSVQRAVVPEPATWLTLLLGFALTGAALRVTPRGNRRSPIG